MVQSHRCTRWNTDCRYFYRSLMPTIMFGGILITQLRYISIHYQLLLQYPGLNQHPTDSTPLTGRIIIPLSNYGNAGTSASNASAIIGTNLAATVSSNSDPLVVYGSGACLMVKDDNDLLYEWIAYHYTVLSLRYIVIGCDIGSRQNVSIVVQRWANANLSLPDQKLHFWILQPNDFVNRHHSDHDGRHRTTTGSTPMEHTIYTNETIRDVITNLKDYDHHALVDRQKGFITVCSDILKAAGVAWTLYIDSDEFIVWNPLSDDEKKDEEEKYIQSSTSYGNPIGHNQHQSMSNRSYAIRKQFTKLKSMRTDGTNPNYYNLIQQLNQQRDMSECYTMPRLLVGALENRTCPERYGVKEVQELARSQLGDYRFSHMSTLRYFQHAKKGDFSRSKYGKVMMDLTKVEFDTIQSKSPRNIHRPYAKHCQAAGGVYFPDSYFFILHYIGSWERYMSRGSNDRRRNRMEWEYRADVDDGNMSACDSTVHHWFVQFQQLVSDGRTKYLLGVS